MKIVFMEADSLGRDVDLSAFKALGDVRVYRRSDPGKNGERIKDADIVIANKIILNKELLEHAENLKLICLTATGTNVVDFSYVNGRGIPVTNVKSYSTMSVAQHTFALLFYVYEKLAYYDTFVKSGDYARCGLFSHFEKEFRELDGKTWGIIGLGEIGRKVAQLARCFGCHVIYYSTTGKNNDPDYERVDYDTLLASSDIISIHAPLTVQTEKLVDERAFQKMKREAVLLNLGRGPIVDQRALTQALLTSEIAGAGIDVLEQEPMAEDDPLLSIQDSAKLIVTPHIAWAAKEARQRCVDEVYQTILSWPKGEARNVGVQ